MILIVSNANNNKELLEVGDLVIFSGVSQQSIKNKIGIIIGHSSSSSDPELLAGEEWYVVQFGAMKLIVSENMIEKLGKDNV